MRCWLSFVVMLGLSACSRAQSPATAQAAPARHPPVASAQAGKYPAPIRALLARGLTIKGPLAAPDGYKGYVADYGGRPVPVYLLPDGKHAMAGTLFDASGRDLTTAPLQAASAPALDAQVWQRLGEATWIAEGAQHPRRIVYEFIDTECPYCHKLWLATQPMLEGNGVQVRHIMVAVIAPQSMGRAAALLDAADPQAALRRHENGFGHSPIEPLEKVPSAIAQSIRDNNALMGELGITGTPGIVYKDVQGKIHVAVGMPAAERIQAIFGK
jgi:thiol:disulfide interchange protein DsbG